MRTFRTRSLSTASFIWLSFSLAVLAILYYEASIFWQAPPSWGTDFNIFYAAASLFWRHGNPYDITQLFARELAIFHPTGNWRAALASEPYPQSPLFLVLLAPLLVVSPQLAYIVTACAIGLSIVGTLVLLNRLFPVPNAFPRVLLLAISPTCLLGIHSGQIDALLLFAMVTAWLAVESRRFALGGALLSIALIKPNIFLAPIIMLLCLAYRRGGARRYTIGLATGFVISSVMWSAIGGPDMSFQWIQGMASFRKHISGFLPSDPLLTTLYAAWMSPRASSIIAMALPVFWLSSMLLVWRYCRSHERQMWWLMFGLTTWIVITPHAHEYDDILVLPAIWWAWQRLSTSPIDCLLRNLFWILWIICPLTFLFKFDYRSLPIRGTGSLPMLVLIVALVLIVTRKGTKHKASEHKHIRRLIA